MFQEETVTVSRICVFLLAACLPSAVLAQVNGTINGTVTDASQAAIPGANLVLKNTQTGETRQASSSPDGFFTFIDLTRGEYSIRVTAQGFRELQLGPLVLTVGQQMTIRPKLDIGSVTETVREYCCGPRFTLGTPPDMIVTLGLADEKVESTFE